MAPNPPSEDPPAPDDVVDYADHVQDDVDQISSDQDGDFDRDGDLDRDGDFDQDGTEQFQGDRPGAEQYSTGEYPAEFYPVAGPMAQNYPAETPADAETPPDKDVTGEWPAPGEEDTDPIGFDPVAAHDYPAPSDPLDEHYTLAETYLTAEDHKIDLPGWGTPGEMEAASAGRVRRHRRPLLIAAVVLLLAGVAAAILVAPRFVGNSERTEAVGQNGGDGAAVSGSVDGRTSALFELVDGAAQVQVRTDDLGDDLYQVAGTGVDPKAEESDDTIKLRLPASATGGESKVEIVLNKTVRWTLRLDGGTARTSVDLTGAAVDGVDLHGGASRIDLALPTPTSQLPVRMTGGVDQFLVKLAAATPVRILVQSGAGQVTLAGATYKGIAPGQSFTANGWSDNTAGIDLQATAGLSALTVTDG